MPVDYAHLKNSYFAMRHGQSMANVAGKIVSDPAIGESDYGLSDYGRHQVLESAEDFAKSLPGCSKIRIISSDFLRARETADLLAESLGSEVEVQFVTELRERYFGEFDGQSDRNYQRVWELDKDNPEHQVFGVESVNSVWGRVERLITSLEQQNRGEQFVLVAHGDVLQIAQTLFLGVAAEQHRKLPHLDVAEIRHLQAS